MDERTITLLLRLVHILAGIFWVGAIFLIAGFLLPTARATGREGGRFMQHLMLQRRLPVFLAVAMLLTVLSGFTMYGRLVAATNGAWASTPPAMAYGAGGVVKAGDAGKRGRGEGSSGSAAAHVKGRTDLLTGGRSERPWIGAHDPTAFRRQQGELERAVHCRLHGQLPRCRYIQDADCTVGLAGAEAEAVPWVTALTDDRDEHQPIAVDRQVPLITGREIKEPTQGESCWRHAQNFLG